ncbi:hypothetical protein Mapa_006667 [Marchantia paleacea]|nr:hypothetical protein Mapa_006667 [Marchantia paleacea]
MFYRHGIVDVLQRLQTFFLVFWAEIGPTNIKSFVAIWSRGEAHGSGSSWRWCWFLVFLCPTHCLWSNCHRWKHDTLELSV